MTERGMVKRKRHAGSGKGQENAKKILNRRNELKDLLKTKDLVLLAAKNELKTDSILSAKMRNLEPKNTAQVAGFCPTGGGLSQAEVWCVKAGWRKANWKEKPQSVLTEKTCGPQRGWTRSPSTPSGLTGYSCFPSVCFTYGYSWTGPSRGHTQPTFLAPNFYLVPLSLGSLLTCGRDCASLYTTLYTTGPSGVGACSTFGMVLWPWGKEKVQWSAVVE